MKIIPGALEWARSQGWKLQPFQRAAAEAIQAGRSGLVHAPTGTGKTLAVWLPLLDRLGASDASKPHDPAGASLRVLWVTPLRALSQDTLRALRRPVEDLGMKWKVEARTGDTSASVKARQRKRLPEALVTTPESLTLLLTDPEPWKHFEALDAVVVDEWHELLGSKRGIQTELALARLRQWRPDLQTWGLSATLGNLDLALAALLGPGAADQGCLIPGDLKKRIELETLTPRTMDRFPWAGHLGLRLLPEVVESIDAAKSTLVFTNTRSQAELWFQALLQARPGWVGEIGLHHGSLHREERESVEERLREGTIRAVVCTSSLDLGVDFSPVEQVIQVGGPKGIARLIQRAGRCGHKPGATSRILCVPTQAMELAEYAAARSAMERNEIEPRTPPSAPLDVLAQHLVSCATGGGFLRAQLFDEVRSTHAYQHLEEREFDWALQFVVHGGQALRAYPEFARVIEKDGRFQVSSPLIQRLHRMQIGTISGDAAVTVRFASGRTLGTVEESFVARMKPGTRFSFAGRSLELVRVRDLTALVRPASKQARAAAVWSGSRLSFSSELSAAVRRELNEAIDGRYSSPEMRSIRGVLGIQSTWSCVPTSTQLLIESTETREGRHWFLFPFAGRLAHEGLGALLAHRIAQDLPCTITVAVNDYGLELLPTRVIDADAHAWRAWLSPERLLEDLTACLNTSELARRQFREVARVAGLVSQGFPGAKKQLRQVQASSGLFYDVFTRYEPDHLLLEQARNEVLERQLDVRRLREVLEWVRSADVVLKAPARLTPFAFPLWAEMIRSSVSTEGWEDRVARMAAELETAAQGGRNG